MRAQRREAIQSPTRGWIASSQALLAMTGERSAHFLCAAQEMSESQISNAVYPLHAQRGDRNLL
jgi:hypothetical protein